MLEWIVRKMLGTEIAVRFLRTKALSVAGAIAAWLTVNTVVTDERGLTQAISAILIGILDIAFMFFHAWTERTAIQNGKK